MCVCLLISVCKEENVDFIPTAYCTLDSLDIFNLILMVLRPNLTGILFDLILKYRAALILSLYHFLPSLMAPVLSSLLSLYYQCSFCAFLHKCVWVQLCGECFKCMCVCSWMTGQGLWTLRPGWRIERPLEAPWKLLQPVLTPSRGRGAREGRSKPERRGQKVDVKRKIRGASTVQGSICGLCRISKRVSTVSKKASKPGRVYCCETLATLEEEERAVTLPWGAMPSPMAPNSCDGGVALKDIMLEMLQMPVEFLNSELWVIVNNTEKQLLNRFICILKHLLCSSHGEGS